MRLIVLGDGKAILELPEGTPRSTIEDIREAWRTWAESAGREVLMVPAPVELLAELTVSGELEVREVKP